MSVQLSVKVDTRQLKRELKENGSKWAKQMEYATKDMRRAGNTVIARQTASIYAIRQGKVNANSKSFKGHCNMSGGLATMTWMYTGGMQTPVDFRMTPQSPNPKRRYTVKATILKGHRVKIGHGGPPGSEGGRHARPAQSPAFFLPGIKPPVHRDGGGSFTSVRVISTPQMVTSDRHIDATMDMLQQRHYEIVMRRLGALGLS